MREEEEEVYKLGLCATLLAPSSIDAWRTIWGVREDKELRGKEEREILNQKDVNWCVVKLHTTG